jgi:hypothetical protein
MVSTRIPATVIFVAVSAAAFLTMLTRSQKVLDEPGLPVAGEAIRFQSQPPAAEIASIPSWSCNSEDRIVFQPGTLTVSAPPCAGTAKNSNRIKDDRAYLILTASPGDTMMRQGPELAIGRLHPEFVHRLASAIREARQSGLPTAGIYSAYRPPVFGVGGFSDKFNSLHTYGLAVDMSGIGAPSTEEARLWYEIAARHGIVCPYGSDNQVEWNHCQPTRVRIVGTASPLRRTVTTEGPLSLDDMFKVGAALIDDPQNIDVAPISGPSRLEASSIIRAQYSRVPVWCRHLHNPSKEACGQVHQVDTTIKTSILVNRLRH